MFVCDNIENSLIDTFEYVQNFEYVKKGKIKKINEEDKEFVFLLNNISKLFSFSTVLPAFGVSLHDETLIELKNGEWLQINFKKTVNVNGLYFDSLLFKLEKTGGVNLIRKFNGKYEGRCVFIAFEEEVDLKEKLIKFNF